MEKIMTIKTNQQIRTENNKFNENDSLVDSVRILSDLTRKDIEKSYNIHNTNNTEAYYSNRYGWTLRRTID